MTCYRKEKNSKRRNLTSKTRGRDDKVSKSKGHGIVSIMRKIIGIIMIKKEEEVLCKERRSICLEHARRVLQLFVKKVKTALPQFLRVSPLAH